MPETAASETRACPACGVKAKASAEKFSGPMKCPKCGNFGIFVGKDPIILPAPKIQESLYDPIPEMEISSRAGRFSWQSSPKTRVDLGVQGIVLNLNEGAPNIVRTQSAIAAPEMVHCAAIFGLFLRYDPDLMKHAEMKNTKVKILFSLFRDDWRFIQMAIQSRVESGAGEPSEGQLCTLEKFGCAKRLLEEITADQASILLAICRLREQIDSSAPSPKEARDICAAIQREARGHAIPPPACSNCGAVLIRSPAMARDWGIVLCAILAAGSLLGSCAYEDSAASRLDALRGTVFFFAFFLSALLLKIVGRGYFFTCENCRMRFNEPPR